MTHENDALAALHTQLLDAIEGYATARELAGRREMIAVFSELHDLHSGNAAAIASELVRMGIEPDQDGTFMALVHRAVLNVRSMLTGLEENVLPAIRDGEERNLKAYDAARGSLPANSPTAALLARQRAQIAERVAALTCRHVSA